MGRRFLFSAGGPVGSQTCAAVQLKGAALGVRVPGRVRPGPRLLPRGARGAEPGERPVGGELATWPAPGGRAGLRVGADRPPSSAAAASDLFSVVPLPRPPFTSERCGRPLASPLPRESGPPRRRRRWKPEPGRNRPRRRSRISAPARRAAKVLRRRPAPPQETWRRHSPKRTRQRGGAKSLSSECGGLRSSSPSSTCSDSRGHGAPRWPLPGSLDSAVWKDRGGPGGKAGGLPPRAPRSWACLGRVG